MQSLTTFFLVGVGDGARLFPSLSATKIRYSSPKGSCCVFWCLTFDFNLYFFLCLNPEHPKQPAENNVIPIMAIAAK